MGFDSEQIRVLCDCGREMRVSRRLAGDTVQCSVCGADISLPTALTAKIGPPCGHCGRPWPIDEARCPSCMARSRTRGKRREDREDLETSAVARRKAAEGSAPPTAFQEAAPMDAASTRVKHWYEKPTTGGWRVAAVYVTVASLAALLHSTGDDGARWWLYAAAVGLLTAIGLARGNDGARAIMLAGPFLVAVIGAILIASLTPGAMTAVDITVELILVGLGLTGLSMLTAKHGQVGSVGLGAVLAAVGMIGFCMVASSAGLDKGLLREIVAKLGAGAAEVKEVVTAERPTLGERIGDSDVADPAGLESAIAPADLTEVEGPADPDAAAEGVVVTPEGEPAVDAAAIVELETPDTQPPSTPSVLEHSAIAAVLKSSPGDPGGMVTLPDGDDSPSPEPEDTVPDTTPVADAIAVAPPPAVPEVSWPEAMTAQGFEVRFADREAVMMSTAIVNLGDHDVFETAYEMELDDLHCQVYAYEGVVAAADDPDNAELGLLAKHVAERLRCSLDRQEWRKLKGRQAYLIAGGRYVTSLDWPTRIQACRVGPRVIVLAASFSSERGKRLRGVFLMSLKEPPATE